MNATNNPLITVITVCFNCKDEIEETILSVLRQNFNNYEYIIIDGGSNDGTVNILKKYEKKVSSLISEPDRGVFDAMNKGLKMAHGQWIIFMNAGDYFYSNNSLQCASQYLTPSNYIVYGDTEYRRSMCKKVETALPVEYLEKNMPTCHQSFLVMTDKAREIGFQTKFRYAADYNMIYKLYKEYGPQHISHIPIVISTYNAIEGLTMSNVPAVYLEVQNIREWSLNKILCYVNYSFKRIMNFIRKKI